jgi:hypothetical protein
LIVIDREGQLLATSAALGGEVHLPDGWLDRVADGQVVIADGYWDEKLNKTLMTVAVPVTAANSSFVGALVANVTYRAVLTTLLVFAPGDSGDLFVIAPDGSEIVSPRADARPRAERGLSPAVTETLFASERTPVTYPDGEGNEVIGTLQRVPSLEWAVVAPAHRAPAMTTSYRSRVIGDCTVEAMGRNMRAGYTVIKLRPPPDLSPAFHSESGRSPGERAVCWFACQGRRVYRHDALCEVPHHPAWPGALAGLPQRGRSRRDRRAPRTPRTRNSRQVGDRNPTLHTLPWPWLRGR